MLTGAPPKTWAAASPPPKPVAGTLHRTMPPSRARGSVAFTSGTQGASSTRARCGPLGPSWAQNVPIGPRHRQPTALPPLLPSAPSPPRPSMHSPSRGRNHTGEHAKATARSGRALICRAQHSRPPSPPQQRVGAAQPLGAAALASAHRRAGHHRPSHADKTAGATSRERETSRSTFGSRARHHRGKGRQQWRRRGRAWELGGSTVVGRPRCRLGATGGGGGGGGGGWTISLICIQLSID
jgi:hypothetical protein